MSLPSVQKQIQQDWDNREFAEILTLSIKKISDFLNAFGRRFDALATKSNSLVDMSARSRLAKLNEKLTALERRVDFLEASVR